MAAGDKKSANKLQRELDRVSKELNRTESAVKGAGIAPTAAGAAYHLALSKEIIIKKVCNSIDTIHYGYLVLEEKATKSLAIVTEGLRLGIFQTYKPG